MSNYKKYMYGKETAQIDVELSEDKCWFKGCKYFQWDGKHQCGLLNNIKKCVHHNEIPDKKCITYRIDVKDKNLFKLNGEDKVFTPLEKLNLRGRNGNK